MARDSIRASILAYLDVMRTSTIRPAHSMWPQYNRRLRDVAATMTDEQLAIGPSPEHWPLWATVGHTACQRVFWLCDFAGDSGAETTPFTLNILDDEIRREDFGEDWVHTGGSVIQRVFSHDVHHSAELNETLGIAGLTQIDLWD